MMKGLIFGPSGLAMTPTHTRKNGRLYRYYVSAKILKSGAGSCSIGRVPAADIEQAVVDQIRGLIQTPEIIVGTWRVARRTIPKISEREIKEALTNFDALWGELFPAEQARIVQLLVQRVDITETGVNVVLNIDGLSEFRMSFIRGNRAEKAA